MSGETKRPALSFAIKSHSTMAEMFASWDHCSSSGTPTRMNRLTLSCYVPNVVNPFTVGVQHYCSGDGIPLSRDT